MRGMTWRATCAGPLAEDGCRGWVRDVVRLFDAHARLAVVGLKKACFSRWAGAYTRPLTSST
jgi:hypothetical protein